MFNGVAFWQEPSVAVVAGLTYGRFVAAKGSGTNQRAGWSNNGITWTAATTPNSRSNLSGDFSPDLGLYILVTDTAATDNIISSTNGVTWTLRSKPNTNSLGAVSWCRAWSKFIATGNNHLYQSTDGINWTICFTHSRTGNICLESCYAETPSGTNYFVNALGLTGGVTGAHTIFVYSSDGNTFATYSLLDNGITHRFVQSVVYDASDNLFLAASYTEPNGSIVFSATPSTGWRNYNEPFLSGGSGRNKSGAGNGYYVIPMGQTTSSTTAGIKYSTTGLSASWVTASMPTGAKYIYDIAYASEVNTWVASNYDTTSGFYSFDGASWSSMTALQNVFHYTWGPGVRTNGYKQGSGIT